MPFAHLHFQAPMWLLAAIVAVLPLLTRGQSAFAFPFVAMLPEDGVSRWIMRIWRFAGALTLLAISIAMAGPYLAERKVERIGRGAQVMVVLDRSASMNESFAGGDKPQTISKVEAARSVLKDFVRQGGDNMVGMVSFSTSPVFAAPLSTDRAVVLAALDATEAGGMGFTAVARGLGMALDYFEGKPVTGARAILLVSDGGAHLDGKTQDMLRAMFQRHDVALYWIYLRSANGVGLEAPPEGESVNAYPEYALHRYFQSLVTGYHVYEAESPQAVKAAVADIARMQNKPTRFLEAQARDDISAWFYLLAWLGIGVLMVLQRMEVREWRAV